MEIAVLFQRVLYVQYIIVTQYGYETLGRGSFITPLSSSCTQEGHSEFVGSEERDEMVQWLCLLTEDLHYCLEVFFRATSLLAAFLSLMKVGLLCSRF